MHSNPVDPTWRHSLCCTALTGRLEQYRLTRFNQSIPKAEVYTRLRSKYSKVYKLQSVIAMSDTDLKQRVDDIAGSILTKPIGDVIDRDQKTWAKGLRLQRRALAGEFRVLETFMEEKLQRADYRQHSEGIY